jgi:hypothetical protein
MERHAMGVNPYFFMAKFLVTDLAIGFFPDDKVSGLQLVVFQLSVELFHFS